MAFSFEDGNVWFVNCSVSRNVNHAWMRGEYRSCALFTERCNVSRGKIERERGGGRRELFDNLTPLPTARRRPPDVVTAGRIAARGWSLVGVGVWGRTFRWGSIFLYFYFATRRCSGVIVHCTGSRKKGWMGGWVTCRRREDWGVRDRGKVGELAPVTPVPPPLGRKWLSHRK